MKKNSLFYKSSGQSLLELLVALTLVTLIVVSVVSLAAVSIKTAYFAKRQTLAKRYAEELIEWLREQKKSNWYSFLYLKSDQSGKTYCFSSLENWPSPSSCTDPVLDGLYKREVVLRRSIDNTKVSVSIDVSWSDSMGTHHVKLDSVFSEPD